MPEEMLTRRALYPWLNIREHRLIRPHGMAGSSGVEDMSGHRRCFFDVKHAGLAEICLARFHPGLAGSDREIRQGNARDQWLRGGCQIYRSEKRGC